MNLSTIDPAENFEAFVDVDRAVELKREIAAAGERLKVIEQRIIDRGARKHFGSDGKTSVTVVAASEAKPGVVSYDWPDAQSDEDAATVEASIRDLAGHHFAKLFVREVIFYPVEGFVPIAQAVLTPKRAEKIIGICSKQGRATSGKAAYLIYPKA